MKPVDKAEMGRQGVREQLAQRVRADLEAWETFERSKWCDGIDPASEAFAVLATPTCPKIGPRGRCMRHAGHAGLHVGAVLGTNGQLASIETWTDEECRPEGEGELPFGGAVEALNEAQRYLAAAEALLETHGRPEVASKVGESRERLHEALFAVTDAKPSPPTS